MTPRERQVAAELARIACRESGGHDYRKSSLAPDVWLPCSKCGEPYPVVVDPRGGSYYGINLVIDEAIPPGDAFIFNDPSPHVGTVTEWKMGASPGDAFHQLQAYMAGFGLAAGRAANSFSVLKNVLS